MLNSYIYIYHYILIMFKSSWISICSSYLKALHPIKSHQVPLNPMNINPSFTTVLSMSFFTPLPVVVPWHPPWRSVAWCAGPELCAALRAEAVAMLEEVRNLARWSWHIVAEIEEFQGFCSRDFEGFSGFFRGMLMDVFIVRRCWGILPDFHGFWPTKMVVHPTTNQLTIFFPINLQFWRLLYGLYYF